MVARNEASVACQILSPDIVPPRSQPSRTDRSFVAFFTLLAFTMCIRRWAPIGTKGPSWPARSKCEQPAAVVESVSRRPLASPATKFRRTLSRHASEEPVLSPVIFAVVALVVDRGAGGAPG